MSQKQWIELFKKRTPSEPVQVPEDGNTQLRLLPNIRAVVFDVYGTLISSGVGDISLATEQNRNEALKAVLKDNGIVLKNANPTFRFDDALHDVIKVHQKKQQAKGITYPEVDIRNVWKDFVRNLTATGLIETSEKTQIETLVIDYESRVNPTQAMPSAKETLFELHKAGYALSIISNAQFYTPLLFDAFLGAELPKLGFCMDSSVWSYKQLEGKPSVKLYELAAARLDEKHGIRSDEVLYIGNDLRNDIWPAQKVGFKTAIFAGDRLSLRRRLNDPDCEGVVADIEITKLSQILDCIHSSLL